MGLPQTVVKKPMIEIGQKTLKSITFSRDGWLHERFFFQQ